MSHEWRGGADGRCVFEVLDHRSGYRGPCALSAEHPVHTITAVQQHPFRPGHTGRTCEEMMLVDGYGEPCGRAPEDPVHTVNEDELPGMWEAADFVDNKPEPGNRTDLPPDLEKKLDEYVEANNLVPLPPEMHEQFDSDDRSGAGDGGWSTKIVPSEAALPYAGTSGWSGSETSRATAVDQDNDGRTLDKQQKALWLFSQHMPVNVAGTIDHYTGRSYGMTWRELDTLTSWGHGSTSRVLSDLHKAGLLARLSEVRNRCKVYVLPEYVEGRETEPHGGRGGDRLTSVERTTARLAAEEAGANIWGLDVSDLLTDLVNIIDRLAPEPKD